jgi:hypothetical protein
MPPNCRANYGCQCVCSPRSLLMHIMNSTVGFKFIPNTGNCSTCWWLSSKLILAIVVVPLYCFRTSSTTSIQSCVAQRTTFQSSLLLSTARSAHAARHSRDTCANITLQFRARIVTTCYFVPKILTIKK